MKISIQIETAKQSKQWPQYLAVISATLFSFSMGLHVAWPSPALPILMSDKSGINVTLEEGSYIALIAPVGNIFGAPLAAVLAEVIGRKIGILLISIPIFTAWIIIAFAENVVALCIGRFISGISDGFIFIVLPMYVGEVAEPHVRGVLGCCMSVMSITGMLVINTYGSYLSIKESALISSAFPVLCAAIFIWMPESPVYLLMKGKVEEATKSLTFLRRCDVTKCLEVMQCDVKRQMSEKGSYKDIFRINSNRKALLILIGVRTVQQMSGISALGLFTQMIFLEAGGDISPVLAAIIYLLTQLVMTIFGSILVDMYGRKPLLMFSSVGAGVMLNLGGVYFYLKEMTDYDLTSLSWLPIFIMSSFIIIYSVGLGTVPSLMLGELFSASVKGKALCVTCIYYSIVISCMAKLFSILTETFGMFSAFFFFGTASFLSIIFSYYFVPETKNKSLEEIQQILKRNCNNMTPPQNRY